MPKRPEALPTVLSPGEDAPVCERLPLTTPTAKHVSGTDSPQIGNWFLSSWDFS